MTMEEIENSIKVSIDQFYGIEINDFAVAVAKTAMWIAENQMLQETEILIKKNIPVLPLAFPSAATISPSSPTNFFIKFIITVATFFRLPN